MSSIPPIGVVGATPTTSAPPPAPKQTLDSEVFLQLLVAQMKNQDPSSPLDTNEMMAQTTQLAMMEQL
ncbi:MAG: flagellar hook capping protein, partial [Microbacterium sp.]|nr:flagellar hook capping protein [Microbacterium sp.]